MLCLNGFYLVSYYSYVHPLQYILKKVTRDEYIQDFRPEYASYQYANQHLSNSSKILGIFLGNRGYYSDINIEFNIDKLKKIASNVNSSELIAQKLLQENFDYLLINFEMFNLFAKKYSPHEKMMLKDFFNAYTVNKFSKDGYGLLQILPKPID